MILGFIKTLSQKVYFRTMYKVSCVFEAMLRTIFSNELRDSLDGSTTFSYYA